MFELSEPVVRFVTEMLFLFLGCYLGRTIMVRSLDRCAAESASPRQAAATCLDRAMSDWGVKEQDYHGK